VKRNEITILVILCRLGALLTDRLEGAKDTLGEVQIVRYVVEGLQGSKIRLTPLTNNHDISQSDFFALLLDFFNELALFQNTRMELLQHFPDQVVVQVNLLLELLGIDLLQKVASFAVTIVPGCQVFKDIAFLVHLNGGETAVLLAILFVVKEEILLFFPLSFKGLQNTLGIVRFVLFSQCLQLNVDVNGKTLEREQLLEFLVD
jgi:hypothetical protein